MLLLGVRKSHEVLPDLFLLKFSRSLIRYEGFSQNFSYHYMTVFEKLCLFISGSRLFFYLCFDNTVMYLSGYNMLIMLCFFGACFANIFVFWQRRQKQFNAAVLHQLSAKVGVSKVRCCFEKIRKMLIKFFNPLRGLRTKNFERG